MTFVRPGTFGGAFGHGGEQVFEWNRTDISQFSGASPDYVASAGGTTQTLSVVAVSERGNALRIASDGENAGLRAVWLLPAIDFDGSERRDLVIEIEYADRNVGSGRHSGVVFLANAVGDHHLAYVYDSLNGAPYIEDNGTQKALSFDSFVSDANRAVLELRSRKPSAAPPQASLYVRNQASGGMNRNAYRTGTSIAIRGNMPAMGDGTALNASWNSLDCDRVGLQIGCSGAPTAGAFSADILDLRIFKVAS